MESAYSETTLVFTTNSEKVARLVYARDKQSHDTLLRILIDSKSTRNVTAVLPPRFASQSNVPQVIKHKLDGREV